MEPTQSTTVSNEKVKMSPRAWLVIIVLIVIALLAAMLIGSGKNQRLARYDSTRVGNLIDLQQHITSYWQQKGTLPSSLSDLSAPDRGYTLPLDPATKAEYGYMVTGDKQFQLCANFDTEATGSHLGSADLPAVPGSAPAENWNHHPGVACFERTINPDLFPPMLKTEKPLIPPSETNAS